MTGGHHFTGRSSPLRRVAARPIRVQAGESARAGRFAATRLMARIGQRTQVGPPDCASVPAERGPDRRRRCRLLRPGACAQQPVPAQISTSGLRSEIMASAQAPRTDLARNDRYQ